MDRLYLKEVYLTNNISNKEFVVSNMTLRNRFKLVEGKLIIFFNYINSNIELNKEIKIVPIDDINKYSIGNYYDIYLASDNQINDTRPNTSILGREE